ncbi:HDOD domain-containing protein [Paraglaciecola aquimarina]|uniref:HDOD domain-containing protein n=1 Tax=Paraglaciecola algarum TaxID=3050085 RepID=A0ABS9D8R9_9ALTE|nr:HDOD domain-containing protein [Paraglaciecola sp. G1-23]MCF2948782.1 HDOD domain-containing protein [Paraglaciecola sp. G1-23]
MSHKKAPIDCSPIALLQKEVLLARQPILNEKHNIYGYEALYRGCLFDINNTDDGMGATGELLNNICACVLDVEVNDNLPVFINVDEKFINSPGFFPVQSDKIILEILESVPATTSVLNNIVALKKQGFGFALDDYIFEPEREPFLNLVSIVKVDVLACTPEELKKGVQNLAKYSVTLLAEKVESNEMFDLCRALGFTLFQGYYLERPRLIHGTKISASQQITLQLLSELTKPNISNQQIAEAILRDPRLAMKMILLVNSSLFSFIRKVSDVREAVIMLGVEAVKRWAIILLLVSESESPVEIFRTLLSRAKTLELCVMDTNLKNDGEYFSLGLFSGIDAVLGLNMQQVTEILPLSNELKDALCERRGPMGELLSNLIRFEKNQRPKSENESFKLLNSAYWQGLKWADELMGGIIQ